MDDKQNTSTPTESSKRTEPRQVVDPVFDQKPPPEHPTFDPLGLHRRGNRSSSAE